MEEVENHIPNKFINIKPAQLNIPEAKNQLRQDLLSFQTTIKENFSSTSMRCWHSNGENSLDTGMYTGSGGLLYGVHKMLAYLGKEAKSDPKMAELMKEWEKYMREAMRSNVELNGLIAMDEEERQEEFSSFLNSESVSHALLHFLECVRTEKIDWIFIQHILSARVVAAEPRSSKEPGLLNGAAGYMFILMKFEKELQKLNKNNKFGFHLEKIHALIMNAAISILEQCVRKEMHLCVSSVTRKKNKTVLRFSERQKVTYLVCAVDGEFLLGAADGISGILYQLLYAMKLIRTLRENPLLRKVVLATLERLLLLMDQNNGYLPETDNKKKMFSISWCCGLPGVIPVLTLAYELFPQQKYRLLEAAQRAGQIVWEKGLLLRGNGLCHGISGNGYALNNLYRTFDKLAQNTGLKQLKDHYNEQAQLWRTRSLIFALALNDVEMKLKCCKFEDTNKDIQGIPNFPYSLMEGVAGDICFLSDLLRDEKDARFPAYEI